MIKKNFNRPYGRYHHPRKHTGPVRRVTQRLAEKFGVSRKLVFAGFILGMIVNFLLTVITFLAVLYWVDHPGKLERLFDRAAAKLRAVFHRNHAQYNPNKYAYADGKMNEGDEPEYDFEFDDLRREFDDLERRSAAMEKHVSSDEYKLNSEFKKMKNDAE